MAIQGTFHVHVEYGAEATNKGSLQPTKSLLELSNGVVNCGQFVND